LEHVRAELLTREPIFDKPPFGIRREDHAAQTAEDYWEVGAFGRIYEREGLLDGLVERGKARAMRTGSLVTPAAANLGRARKRLPIDSTRLALDAAGNDLAPPGCRLEGGLPPGNADSELVNSVSLPVFELGPGGVGAEPEQSRLGHRVDALVDPIQLPLCDATAHLRWPESRLEQLRAGPRRVGPRRCRPQPPKT